MKEECATQRKWLEDDGLPLEFESQNVHRNPACGSWRCARARYHSRGHVLSSKTVDVSMMLKLKL
jgi:hypothetical protein